MMVTALHTLTHTHIYTSSSPSPSPPHAAPPSQHLIAHVMSCSEWDYLCGGTWGPCALGGTSCRPSSPGNTFRMMFSMKRRGKNLSSSCCIWPSCIRPSTASRLLPHPLTPWGPFVSLIIHYREVAFALKPVEVDEAWPWPTKHRSILEPETCLCDRTPVISPSSINLAPSPLTTH